MMNWIMKAIFKTTTGIVPVISVLFMFVSTYFWNRQDNETSQKNLLLPNQKLFTYLSHYASQFFFLHDSALVFDFVFSFENVLWNN